MARTEKNPLQRFLDETDGMTQVKFGELVEIQQSEISKYARGERKPSIPFAARIHLATDGKVPVTYWYPELTEVIDKILDENRAA